MGSPSTRPWLKSGKNIPPYGLVFSAKPIPITPAPKGIQGAFDRVQVFLHDMGVDLHVRMPHKLLHDPDIDSVFK